MTDELHRVIPGYAHDDTFLELVAGIDATMRKFDALVAAHVPASSDGPVGNDVPPVIVDAVLGLVALRERLAGALLSAAAEPVLSTAATSRGPQESLRR